jgi:hypothetical protein
MRQGMTSIYTWGDVTKQKKDIKWN